MLMHNIGIGCIAVGVTATIFIQASRWMNKQGWWSGGNIQMIAVAFVAAGVIYLPL